jgi:hypothetical protein
LPAFALVASGVQRSPVPKVPRNRSESWARDVPRCALRAWELGSRPRGWRRRRVGELVLGLLATAELVGWFLGACRRWAARRAAGSVTAWLRATEESGELFGIGTGYRG